MGENEFIAHLIRSFDTISFAILTSPVFRKLWGVLLLEGCVELGKWNSSKCFSVELTSSVNSPDGNLSVPMVYRGSFASDFISRLELAEYVTDDVCFHISLCF